MKKLKICLISSHGGHLHELLKATETVSGEKYFVTYQTAHTQQTLAQQKKYFVIDPHLSKWKYLLNACQSLLHILMERPDVVISTGAGIAIPTMLICKTLLRSKIIYIESAACVVKASKTGSFIYKYSDLFLVQWSSMQQHYEKAVYAGLQ
jgi:UDP-N-acetylglucosamine:LPS N-acetylglucosamine transferase